MDSKTLFEELCNLARHHKQTWVAVTNRGDMPPTVIGIKDGKPLILVICPQIDKALAFDALYKLRFSLAIDEACVIFDSHMLLTKGKSQEEVMRLNEKYAGKPGSMQDACDEEGACGLKEISDCLMIFSINKEFKFNVSNFAYDYHGKDAGSEFTWTPEHDTGMTVAEYRDYHIQEALNEAEKSSEAESEDNSEKQYLCGAIPANVFNIMKSPTIFEDPTFIALMNVNGEAFLREKSSKIAEVAVRGQLIKADFVLMDCICADSFESYFEQLQEKYATSILARSMGPVPSTEQLMVQLGKMEEMAQKAGDTKALESLRLIREKLAEKIAANKTEDSQALQEKTTGKDGNS